MSLMCRLFGCNYVFVRNGSNKNVCTRCGKTVMALDHGSELVVVHVEGTDAEVTIDES